MNLGLKALGLTDSATEAQVKEAWRRLASVHHPDKGGSTQAFHELRQAYQEALEECRRPIQCFECKGAGQITFTQGWASVKIRCTTCNGKGEIPR